MTAVTPETSADGDEPLVSALIPTYNRAEFVEGAVETVLGQTHDTIEAVVVNDGSTDDTRERLDAYADHDRVRVFHNDENRGIAYTFNRAAEEAAGDYYCILGDDDRWAPHKVEKQLDVFERAGPDLGVVYTWGVETQGGRVTQVIDHETSGDLFPEMLGSWEVGYHSSHMLRRACFESVGGFDTSLPRGVDWDMCIRIAREWEFAYVPEYLTKRQLHGDNVSVGGGTTDVTSMIREKYADELAANPEVAHQFAARTHFLRAYRGVRSAERGRRDTLAQAVRAFRLDPSVSAALLLGLSLAGPTVAGTAFTAKEWLTARRNAGVDAEWALGGEPTT